MFGLAAGLGFPVRLVSNILFGCFLDQWSDNIAHRCDWIGNTFPVTAVPLLDKDRAASFVVSTIAFNWRRKAFKAKFLQASVRKIKALKSCTHVGTSDGLLAGLFLCRADSFSHNHSVEQATIVKNITNVFFLGLTATSVHNMLDHVLQCRVIGANA